MTAKVKLWKGQGVRRVFLRLDVLTREAAAAVFVPVPPSITGGLESGNHRAASRSASTLPKLQFHLFTPLFCTTYFNIYQLNQCHPFSSCVFHVYPTFPPNLQELAVSR